MKTRWTRRDAVVWGGVLMILALAGVATATPPWKKLVPFRSVEADSTKMYWLTEDEGPWMIMATSFAGPGAEEQAHTLVLELRKQHKLNAFMHKQTFDYTQPVQGRGVNRYGAPKLMKYQAATKFDEIAVLVGNYASYDAPGLEEDLERVKAIKPECLDISNDDSKKKTTQRFIGLRELQRLVHSDPKVRESGPMRRAFVARNPLLPKEYFVSNGLDPFVVEMNRNVEHSLLDNPGQYTVRVASFQGESSFQGEEQRADSKRGGHSLVPHSAPNKLEIAADNAHRLTLALRKRGVDAYEFHDRFESIVTVGSFNSVGKELPDGRLDLAPEVYKIMQSYGAEKVALRQNGQGMKPRTLDGIPFDLQPLPVKVPREGLASNYTAGNERLR
jgi:hypothetical protein